ncbi:MAG: reprolysin-like metallopeptidase [Bacteroidota bacterium]
MRTFLFSIIILFFSATLTAQNLWTDVAPQAITSLQDDQIRPLPHAYRVVNLDLDALKTVLQSAPMEFSNAARNNPLLIKLPLPDGTTQTFEVAVSPMMEQGLADKFPDIKTYILQGVDDKTASGRMDINPNYFHGYIISARGSFIIDPAGNHYISFFKKDQHLQKNVKSDCGHDHADTNDVDQVALRTSSSVGENLRTYRFATCTTGGFAQFHGGTTDAVIAALVTIINRLNTVYERDIAVRLILVAENDQLLFFDDATDPFTGGNTGAMIGQTTSVINGIIGADAYDIGHVVDDGGGGLAQLQSVCGNGKARGVTGIFPPIGDLMAVEYLGHEVGHQFGANHTFNNCGGNENQGTGFEPGSGSTIMSYSGLCGTTNNVQLTSDDYFHGISVQEMLNFIDNGGVNCAELIPTNNTPPTVEVIEGGFSIPISTPFELTAISTDAEGDELTYCWEQFNSGPQVPLGEPSGSAPLFRTFDPTTSPTRVFPAIERVINNNLYSAREYTPDYERSLAFNVTVRDNNAGAGGIAFDGLSFEATETAGPFLVEYPNEATIWEVGQWLEVLWDVANTDNNVVNCQKVNIKLSVDGGFTYPYTLITNTANDGSEFISVPNVVTNQARVRVEAADNIFFDISNNNFTIDPPSQEGFAYFVTPNAQEICLPTQTSIDIVTESLLGYDEPVTYNIVSTLPSGVVPNFSANPALPSDGSVLSLDMDAYNLSDTFDVVIEAIAPGVDTAYRTVTIRTIGNDFSDLALELPIDGESGVPELQEFNWKRSNQADQYLVQIARSPTFDPATMHAEQITTDTFFVLPVQLDINTVYYWRVRPSNECGFSDFVDTRAFHTIVFSCEKFENNDSETIASTGLATVENKITINSGGTISDLNVSKIKGFHNNMNHLDVSLISPEETEVLLFSNKCLLTTNFDLGMDDEAAVNVQCPPTNGTFFLPDNPLSAFDGESAEGEWILRTQVNNTAGSGGKIQEFHLTICSDVSLSPPVLITNEVLPLPPASGRAITGEFLLTEDANNTPAELIYTVVSAPAHGQLFFLGTEINLGDTFRQSSVSAGNVTYVHNGDNNQFDAFTFTVTDGEGGFIGTPQFNIEIDPDAVVSVDDLLDENEIRIFPNPNDGNFNVLFEKPIFEQLRINMFNVHGQLILEQNLDEVIANINIQTQDLPEGIYFLRIETRDEFVVKKMFVK